MEDISLLYESVLINEMRQDVIDYLDRNKDELPFSKMFGDKLRLVVPIGGDLTAREILEDLKSLKDYSGIDVGSGEVIRKIKLDPKYGQGSEKEQKMSIGKAVNSLKIDPEKKKKYLDWLAKYKDNLNTALSDISDYVIILSRAPIDVVRMSDHRNISSCHSQGGSFFQCAVQEAVTGGAVAYVVDRDMLDYHLNGGVDALQDDDFFHDTDRGVQGIRPVARLRVRRIESNDGEELGVPDDRVYGDSSIPGFWKYLNEFLKTNQKEVIDSFIDSGGRGWESRGGSYYEANTDIDELTSNFIGSEIRNRIHYNSDDSSNESSWATQGWEDELEEIKNSYNNSMTYCSVDYQLEEDEQPYIMPSGGCTIDISSFGLPDDTDLYIDDYYDIKRKGVNGHYDDDYIWSYVVSYLLKQVGDAGIGNLTINDQSIDISFYDENNSILNSPDSFDIDFCCYVEIFDRKIEDMLEDPDELRHIFEEAGLLNATDYTNPEYSRYAEYEEDNVDFYSKINLDGERNDFMVSFLDSSFIVSPIGSPPGIPLMQFKQWPQLFKKFIYNFAKEHFRPKIDVNSEHPTFKNFFESYTNPMEDIDFTVLPFQMNITHFAMNIPRYTITNEKIKIKPSGLSNKYFEFFDFLDDIYPHLNNFFKMSVLMSISRDDPEMFQFYKHHNLPQLEKLYGKYID